MGPSGLGMIHGGVRWNTDRCFTRAAMVGTIWMALAPVPTTPTFLPSSGYSSSQRAEWNILPWNEASPGMSGSDGRLSGPHPGTSTRARSFLPSLVSTSHSPVRSSKRAAVTRVLNRMCGRTPYLSAQCRRYVRISFCCAKSRVHSGHGSKENEYRCDCTSQAAPG